MSNFTSRLLIGAAYVLVTILAVLGHQLSAAIYVWLIQVFCLFEYYKITMKDMPTKNFGVPVLLGTIVFFMTYVNQNDVVNAGSLVWYLIAGLVLFLSSLVFYRGSNVIAFAGNITFGWLYISVPLAFLLRLGNIELGPEMESILPFNGFYILLVFILIWANDTFAYLVGRKFGKHKLAPSLSPKKTIEGFIGGIICTMAIAFVIFLLNPVFALIHMLVIAIICSVIGTLGDLLESKIKRTLDIKDSGTALGGHGGFLDRMDSIILASPACFLYVYHFVAA